MGKRGSEGLREWGISRAHTRHKIPLTAASIPQRSLPEATPLNNISTCITAPHTPDLLLATHSATAAEDTTAKSSHLMQPQQTAHISKTLFHIQAALLQTIHFWLTRHIHICPKSDMTSHGHSLV